MLTRSWLHQANDGVARTPLDAIHAKNIKKPEKCSGPCFHCAGQPGLQQILDSIRLYRKECATGQSVTDAFKAARLGSSEVTEKFPAVPVEQLFEKKQG